MNTPRPAELPARLAARALDVVILVTVDVALGRRIGFGFDWLLIAASVVLAYFVLADAWAGATLGKAALGLRVIDAEGGRPTLRQAFTREAFTVAGAVPLAGPVLALAAWVWIVVTIRSNPLRQGKHDLIAGTRVIATTPTLDSLTKGTRSGSKEATRT
jgi:uncharacterized RDD family membrane protein YckC